MDHEESAPAAAPAPTPAPAATWPPPHPSPPLPPPREYGSPGTPPDRHHWVWAVVAAVLVVGVLSVGLVYVVGDDTEDPDDPAAGATTSTGPTGTEPEPEPEPADSTPAEPTSSAPPTPFRCWDGSGAQRLADCPAPTGEAGLRWVFPGLASDRCAAPSEPGDGALLRLLCRHTTEDGTVLQIGYYEWESVDAARTFFDDQDLEPSQQTAADGSVEVYQWSGTHGDTLKLVGLFAAEPFSATITMPTGTEFSQGDSAALAARPVDQLRGEPVG